MKKYLVIVAVAIFVAFATPAFAVTNPFIDVPMNHWAHDAISQLAARGVLGGFPDGTFRGNQPMTRFEMSSALARALAVIDMTKASRHDVEMLKRLVVEFKDELDALAVRVDHLDESLGRIGDRLRGWRARGIMVMDVDSWDNDAADAYTNLFRGRLYLERWFGPDEEMFIQARFRNENADGGAEGTQTTILHRFFVEFPFWGETRVTAGRFGWNWENVYSFSTGGVSGLANQYWMTGGTLDGLGITRNFGMGAFRAFFSRSNAAHGTTRPGTPFHDVGAMWHAGAMIGFQMTEQVALDLGVHGRFGDDGNIVGPADGRQTRENSNITYFAGLRFNFNNDISFRGIYYHQTHDSEARASAAAGWYDTSRDNSHAFRLNLSVSQDLLGFTSLWLGYDYLDRDFVTRNSSQGDRLFLSDDAPADVKWRGFDRRGWDTTIWRIGATQQWNSEWRTWAYFARHDYSRPGYADRDVNQWGLGIEYRLNPNVAFALNYLATSWNGAMDAHDNHLIRFRTQVTF